MFELSFEETFQNCHQGSFSIEKKSELNCFNFEFIRDTFKILKIELLFKTSQQLCNRFFSRFIQIQLNYRELSECEDDDAKSVRTTDENKKYCNNIFKFGRSGINFHINF